MSKKKVSITLELDEDIYLKARDFFDKADLSFDDTVNELIRQMILQKHSIEKGLINKDNQQPWFLPNINTAIMQSKLNEEDLKTIQDFLEVFKYSDN